MTLFFMHITKTAGGTIKSMFRDCGVPVQFHYPGEAGFHPQFGYSFATPILYGHYIYGAHDRMGLAPNYACFLRDPIARALSHFHHLHNVDKSHLGDLARQHKTIEAYADQARHWEMDNFQTRVISGVGNDVKFRQMTHAHLRLAMENLDAHFRYIGIFEDLKGSLSRLQGFVPELADKLPHVNKGKYERKIADGTLDKLCDLHRFDLILYDYACELAKTKRSRAAKVAWQKAS